MGSTGGVAAWMIVGVLALPLVEPTERRADTVVVRVDEHPVTWGEFVEFILTDRGEDDPDSLRILDQLVEETVVEEEARRRGIEVAPQDIEERVQALEQRLHQTEGRRLADFLADQNLSQPEFERMLAKSIACEWMMRDDFGLDRGAELTEAKQQLWLAEQKQRISIERLADDPSAAVRVGDRERSRHDWGSKLFRSLPAADRRRYREEFVTILLLDHAARQQQIQVSAADSAEELDLRDRLLQRKLRNNGLPTDGVTYIGMLEARGKTREQHVASPRFRAEILQRLVADRRFGTDGYRGFHADHRARFDRRFGERVQASTISLATGKRSPDEAMGELEALRDRMLEGSDPLARQFERLARIYSEHGSREQGGDLGPLTRDAAARMGLEDDLFGAAAGDMIGPLLTKEGAHLLLVTQRFEALPFDKILPEVREEARRQVVIDLRATTPIEELW